MACECNCAVTRCNDVSRRINGPPGGGKHMNGSGQLCLRVGYVCVGLRMSRGVGGISARYLLFRISQQPKVKSFLL